MEAPIIRLPSAAARWGRHYAYDWNPDSPRPIAAISIVLRDVPPVNSQPIADSVVRRQQAPAAPPPTGMEAALRRSG